ncbi:MAG: hypothetical protein KAT35_03345 [Candidatus Aenigmarchaeota archaeon]|nr:hypothetical protein [Candidatus Aenigmarchaeota archaeon]
MAETFLEAIGVIGGLGAVYFLAPLLIFGIIFAVLSKTKAISDKMDANAMVALIVAFLVGLFPEASLFIALFIPIMVMMLLIIFGGVLIYLFMGASAENLGNFFKHPGTVVFFLLMFTVVFAVSFSAIFPQSYTAYAGNATEYSPELFAGPMGVTATIFHPKVLGTIVFLLLMAISVGAIVAKPKG